MKTAKQLSAEKKARSLLRKDPDHFAKLAAKRKGTKNPNMARPQDKEKSARGGLNRGNSMREQTRRQRSKELEEKLREVKDDEPTKVVHKKKRDAKIKQDINWETENEGVWDNEETTNLDKWS